MLPYSPTTILCASLTKEYVFFFVILSSVSVEYHRTPNKGDLKTKTKTKTNKKPKKQTPTHPTHTHPTHTKTPRMVAPCNLVAFCDNKFCRHLITHGVKYIKQYI